LTRTRLQPSLRQVWSRLVLHASLLTEDLQRLTGVEVVVVVGHKRSPRVVLVQAFPVETFQNTILKRDISMRNIRDNNRRRLSKVDQVAKSRI